MMKRTCPAAGEKAADTGTIPTLRDKHGER
jgi:hypothetical protein